MQMPGVSDRHRTQTPVNQTAGRGGGAGSEVAPFQEQDPISTLGERARCGGAADASPHDDDVVVSGHAQDPSGVTEAGDDASVPRGTAGGGFASHVVKEAPLGLFFVAVATTHDQLPDPRQNGQERTETQSLLHRTYLHYRRRNAGAGRGRPAGRATAQPPEGANGDEDSTGPRALGMVRRTDSALSYSASPSSPDGIRT